MKMQRGSFENCLQKINKDGQQTAEELRGVFTKDVTQIRDHIVAKMQERCPWFKAAFDGFCLTGSIMDGLNIDLPDNFATHMRLKLPFKLLPCEDQQRPGYIKLMTTRERDHPAIEKRVKIGRYALQMWLRTVFMATVQEGLRLVTTNGHEYQINYAKFGRGRGIAHTITAKRQTVDKAVWGFCFDFVPVFEFTHAEWPFKDEKRKLPNDVAKWYAIPLGLDLHMKKEDKSYSYTFMISSIQTSALASINDVGNLRIALRLLKILCVVNGLNELSCYMLKSIFLQEFDELHIEPWLQPVGDILIKLLELLAEDLHEQRFPFLLHKGVNLLDKRTKNITTLYKAKVERLLRCLKKFNDSPNANFDEVATFFTQPSKV